MAIIMVNGSAVDTDNVLPKTYTYNGDGTVATIAFSLNGKTYTQTLTYTSGNLTNESRWVQS